MQQMLMAMNKAQKQYEKEHKTIEDNTYEATANGVIKVTMKGDFTLVSVEFLDDELLSKENKEMISDMIKIAYKNCIDKINEDENILMEKYQGNNMMGMKF